MLEAVINVSEGRDGHTIAEIGRAAGDRLLDVHCDPHHHRSVFTLAGDADPVERAALALARRAVELLDISSHEGVHPRLGVVDVVPFVPYTVAFDVALGARTRFAETFSADGVPCFLYGPERSLPEVRREAWVSLQPDIGPGEPHPTAGACCVGAREVLIAYNLVIDASLARARQIARQLRGPAVRSLGLPLGEASQVSFNLIEPTTVGPAEIYDQVAALVTIERAELVGLVPAAVLEPIPASRFAQLGLSEDRSVEARLASTRHASGPID